MHTYVYMIRHVESPKEGPDRLRGLTDKGRADAERITELLREEGIDVFASSPYRRAVLTVQGLADEAGKEMLLFEDLKEQVFSAEETRMPDKELMPLIHRLYAEPGFSLPDGESNQACQTRAVAVLNQLLETYAGQRIAIGTHGAVMALMMGGYDPHYDLNFLLHTTKPDVYRMQFDGHQLMEVERLWPRRQSEEQG
ncbi:histidine phosphatase family protein [Gorillibacterium sp. CAU 1737]|uniref:histidine phosphatase family protein n=1 Tax=Gorillibacterium sp. CAU 1737 TaxID=3140362 RepID=UPI0032603751